ncbi:UvrD-helicase domain-containing protein [Psychrobacter sp. van23A]|uniref:UvrD-helicase domain-containing protein n=1 Tax=Psychrobacter faecalis TaxID=180588 RepID=UPI0027B8B854|nr:MULTISPECIES: UvrD-helicase domain-containing protein [Psychrobacter]WLW65158.1 UvrD-helicase domain-containing protein [Psychrobacter sp. van23A]
MTEFTATTHMMDISTQPHASDTYQGMTDSEVANHDMIKPKNNADVIPAVDVALTGRHLIEASAGTGKTWTLTGIVLRLLIEARRAPEQIIATTFTRAAAAEMRQRIHDRLVDFYQLLQWVNSLSADRANKESLYPHILQVTPDSDKQAVNSSNTDSNAEIDADELNQDFVYNNVHDKKAAAEKRAQAKKDREDWLVAQAKYVRLDDIMQDPINLHLVGYLLDHVYSYPMTEAIRRTALVLTTLDKLFVGTLDSLAQKWLKEYSSETGHQQGMAIIEDSSIEQVTDSIVHDELRQFQSRLYHEQPKLYALMDQQGKLTAVGDHKNYVTRSLNFISAPIDEVVSSDFSFEGYERLIHSIIERSDELDAFFKPDGEYYEVPKGQLQNNRESWPKIVQVLEESGFAAYKFISDKKTYTGKLIEAFQKTDDIGKQFYKPKDGERVNLIFNELQVVRDFKRYIEESKKLDEYVITILANLNRHIVLAVRDRLPVILEERGETTFSLQMVRLNQALTGRQGEKLARYIRHHYPVALIDESQDINGEQATMIESIYLPTNKRKPSANDKQATGDKASNKTNHEFLLLVGDPKQAIYGFRGGDVANYNYMKAQFDKSSLWTLDINRRSNASVINALNCWFGMPAPVTHENRLAQLGSGIYYRHIKAEKQENQLSWFNDSNILSSELVNDVLSAQPVSVLHLPYDKDKELEYDEHEITARHIATLLSSGQALKGKPIQPSDIGVLARAKKDLKRVEDELVKLNVPTLTTSDVSIFETVMAEDVAALLSAMLYPYRHDMINRVLTSHLYGLSIKDIKAMMIDHEAGAVDLNSANIKAIDNKKSYQDFISYLKEGAQRWQHFGVLSAMHYLLDQSPVQPQGVWQALAAHPEGDRHIMDLRHVMDILAQYGIGMGEYELLAWFRQNIDSAPSSDWAKQYPLPTESGVQLMTIHKSKGLEFPIVYVLGMGDASRKSGNKEDYGLYLYNSQQNPTQQDVTQQSQSALAQQSTGNQRRFSPVQGSATTKGYYTDIETQEGFEELRRLGYVAFTRASEQLYVVLRDPHNKTGFELKPVFYWFESPEPKFELPDRFKGTIGMIRGHKVNEFYNDNCAATKAGKLTESGSPDFITPKTEPIEYDDFSEVMKINYFYGWAKTSFTALARQLDESTQTMAVMDERIDDGIDIDVDINITETSVPPSLGGHASDSHDAAAQVDQASLKLEDDIRFTFVKGANAGTFLHEIFEKIDFNNKSQWSQVIDRAISSYQLPLVYSSAETQSRRLQAKKQEQGDSASLNTDSLDSDSIDASKHAALIGWIEEVLHTPLLASDQPLRSIDASQRFAELEFNMGLSERFKAQDINRLFQQYLPNETDKHVNLVPQNKAHLYRYLRGEIDLVYEHAGKYYVVDYKSNFLGNSLSDYNEATLKQAMSKAGYWLQAAIYQVALHRFLSMRIADYVGNEAKYLGAVEYVFLRGVYDPTSQLVTKAKEANVLSGGDSIASETMHDKPTNRARYGLVTWDIPIDFIKALDALFGMPS